MFGLPKYGICCLTRIPFLRGYHSSRVLATDIVIRGLIDRSGSMSSWKQRVLDGVNAYLWSLKFDLKAKDARVEIFTFDNISTDLIRKSRGADLKLLEPSDFEPRGLTPLFDAVGAVLQPPKDTRRVWDFSPPKRILFIFTDGAENASKKQTKESIRSLIEERQKEGWVILYLGANVNAW